MVNVTVTVAIRLSPCLTRIEAGFGGGQLLPELTRFFIWFWRHHYFNNGEQIAGVGFAHESFPFDTQSLPCLTARWHRQQNALFQGGHRHFRAQRGLPWRQRQDDLQVMTDNIE